MLNKSSDYKEYEQVKRKKITFADEHGLELVCKRII